MYQARNLWPAGFPASPTARATAVGGLCVLLALAGQAALIYRCYDGNWTGLFLIGAQTPYPTALAGENLYVFAGSTGYDGQYYHHVAHDPFRTRGFQTWIDLPNLRYQRILVPMAAWLLAGGSDEYLHTGYFAVILFSVFLGGYWSSRFAVECGCDPLLGLVFLCAPPVLISLERMTVEVSLAALTAGFALYVSRGPAWKLFLVMTAAVFIRETGLFLIGGYVLYCLRQRHLSRAMAFSSSALPGVAWILLTSRGQLPAATSMIVTRGSRTERVLRSFGLLQRVFYRPAIRYRSLPSQARVLIARTADTVAWWGMTATSMLGVRSAFRRNAGPIDMAAAIAGAIALTTGFQGFWFHPMGYTRPFAPLFVLVGLQAIRERRLWYLAPILMVDLRLVVEWGPRLLKIVGIDAVI